MSLVSSIKHLASGDTEVLELHMSEEAGTRQQQGSDIEA